MFDMSNVNVALTAASTVTVGGIAFAVFKNVSKIVRVIEEHKDKVKEAWTILVAFKEHLKQNQPATETAQDIEQAATTDNTDMRDAKIKAALQLIPQALSVEVSNLSNIPVPMIVKYLADRLPEYQEYITPITVTTALQTIGGEVQAAREHDGVKMMQEILAYMQQAAPAAAGDTQTVSSATVPGQQSVPDTASAATTAPTIV